jgi:hypothetical protein
VSGLQRFDKQPEYTEVNPGEDVLMTCKVFNKRGTCSWQKDNKVGLFVVCFPGVTTQCGCIFTAR